MGSIERILVPLDLHRLSEAKLPVATAQARAFGAEIILLHVRPPERAAGAVVSQAESQARTQTCTAHVKSAGARRTSVHRVPFAPLALERLSY